MSWWEDTEPNASRTYKDTVFKDLFGSEKRKGNALSLYNALNGTSYDNPDELEINTIQNAIYLSYRNDVSFLIDGEMVLWEHQSTRNPNMPLRGLVYFARLYAAWIERRGLNVYGTKRIELPLPRFAVFYIGEERQPETETLRLSDAFMRREGTPDVQAALEVECTVYNINEGQNQKVADACEALAGYAHFVALFRAARDNGLDKNKAIDLAMRQCESEGVLADYLSEQRAEVKDMFLTEYDEERQRRIDEREKQERYEEGLAEGRKEVLGVVARLVANGVMDAEKARESFGLTEGVLADYLSEQRAEVKDMFLTEYDEERQRRIDEREKQERYEEGLAEGHAEGRAEGRKEMLLDLVKEGALSLGVVAEKLGMTEDEVQALL